MNNLIAIGILLIGSISCKNTSEKSNNNVGENTLAKTNTVPDTLLNQVDDDIRKNQKNISKNEIKDTSKVSSSKTNYKNYEVVYIDYYKDWLLRVFVTIDTTRVYDKSIIQSVICEIQAHCNLSKKSNITFFSEKKYANYKPTLFMDEDHILPTKEYKNWLNYYYLAEFEFETNIYKTYLSCSKLYKRQKTMIIKCK